MTHRNPAWMLGLVLFMGFVPSQCSVTYYYDPTNSPTWAPSTHPTASLPPTVAPTSVKPLHQHAPNNMREEHQILYISLPIACVLILLLVLASLDWTRIKTKLCHRPSKQEEALVKHDDFILGDSTQEETKSPKSNTPPKCADVSTSSDLCLLETLSCQSDESSMSQLWIQMSQYGDESILSPFDDVDSHYGDWYDDAASC